MPICKTVIMIPSLRCIEKGCLFLKKNNDFWTDFIVGNGSVILILNHTINPEWKNGDKCFELSLTPTFLSHLSARGIGLRVQGWQGPTQKRKSAPPAKGTRIG